MALVQSAAPQHWQAAAWWLERSFPDRYGRRDRNEVSGDLTVGITLERLVRLAAEADNDEA